MFLDEIEKRYPGRVLTYAELSHNGFRVVFDLPEDHHVKIILHVYEGGEHLAIYESVQETSKGRIHFSQGKDYVIDGNASSILPTIKGYLQKAVGDIEAHTYENSFVGWLIEQSVKKGGESVETGGGE